MTSTMLEAVQCTKKPPHQLILENSSPSIDTKRSGCVVIDLVLRKATEIAEITFRNYYTAYFSILLQYGEEEEKTETKITLPAVTSLPDTACWSAKPKQDKKQHQPRLSRAASKTESGASSSGLEFCPRIPSCNWVLSIANVALMPHPHYEEGAQQVVRLKKDKSRCSWKNVIAFRIILCQPSLQWKTFTIEDITVYQEVPRRIRSSSEEQEKPEETLLEVLKRQTRAALHGELVGEADTQEGVPVFLSAGYEVPSFNN